MKTVRTTARSDDLGPSPGLHRGPQRPAARLPGPPPGTRRADPHRIPAAARASVARPTSSGSSSTSATCATASGPCTAPEVDDDHRLPAARRLRTTAWSTSRTTRTASRPRSARSTCTCSTRGGTSSSGQSSAPTCATTPGRSATCRASPSPCGRRGPRRCTSSATSTSGTAAPTRCAPRRQRRLGAVHPRARIAGMNYQYAIRGPDGLRRGSRPTRWRADRGRAQAGGHRHRVPATRGATTSGGTDAATSENPHNGPDERLRGPPRLVAPGARATSSLAEHLVNYVQGPRLHPRRAPAGDGAPLRAVVGLPRDRLLRARRSRFGTPDDFRYLVDRLHQNGHRRASSTGCPGHFATDEWALARFDGKPLYEHPDPRKGWHPEWGSYIFDLGRPEVRNFLVANALYWFEEFHADGLRVDGVASMLYLDYSRQPGEWIPNYYGGRENLEAVAAAPGGERHRLPAVPRHRHRRRGVDVVVRCHGDDRRRAGWGSASSGTWAG